MIEIASPDQKRQLFAKRDRVVDRQMIAHGVQDTAKSQVGLTVIRPVELLDQFPHPRVRTLDRRVEYVEAGKFHAKHTARDVPLFGSAVTQGESNAFHVRFQLSAFDVLADNRR